MINNFINGISAALYAAYPAYDIYADKDVEQGSDEPCFFINLVSSGFDTGIKGTARRTYTFDVMFYPLDDTDKSAMMTVADNLNEVLQDITIGESVIHGDNANYNIVDGIMHYIITYEVYIEYETENNVMTELEWAENDE